MSYQCLNPVLAYCLGTNSEGKKIMSFKIHPEDSIASLQRLYGEDNVYTLPCGQCDSCRKNYSQEWAIRCQLEAMYHPFNYFITLTYEDHHLKRASYKDFQKFIDRLELFNTSKKYKNRVKFFCCEEYGEITHRYHLHAILFLEFPLTLCDEVLKGSFYHYHSKELSKLWRNGVHDITPFETDCGAYVAKYTVKSSDFKDHGNIHMSKNLGKQYFEDHYQEIIDNNFKIYLKTSNNKKQYVPIPRAFVEWFRDKDCEQVEDFVLFNRKIGHLSNIQKTQFVGSRNVEEGIYYSQQLAGSKVRKERRK